MKRNIFRALTALGLTALLSVTVFAAEAGVVSTAGGRLNIRSGMSTGAPTVAQVNRGTYLTLLSRNGNWWQVEYAAGKTGYCHADFITGMESRPASVSTASTGLNVRSGPGTNHARTAVLPKGKQVLVLSDSGGWSRILYHGSKIGYASSAYLSGGTAAVSLDVPDYKQMDSRWADIPIASSGKTMAQIGCATTAIAMMESYRTGEEILPDEMTGMLRYTPSGSVYWPAHYTTVTDGTELLQRLYSLLKQGKPVLFGAKNAYGKQHWVVIRGYDGAGRLSAANFRIHDPGTVSRENLAQFLEQYPYFYKYFYA